MTIKQIKFTELKLSKENMRKATTPKANDKQLKASIAAIGLIQNLVVSAKGEDGLYPVEAGGRRFVQIQSLVKDGVFTEDITWPCRVLEDGESAKDFSLSENLHRYSANPVDEYEAFLYLYEQDGYTISDLASRYGYSKKYVEQQMKLGGVAPELRDLCRNGKMSIEHLQAFTVSSDLERQVEVYKSLEKRGFYYGAHHIKSMLTDEAPNNKEPLVKFVGLAAYKKAGGTTSSDLFGDVIYINTKKLLLALANKKAEKLLSSIDKSWGWSSFDIEFNYSSLSEYQHLEKDDSTAPKALLNKLKKMETQYTEIENMDDEEFEATEGLEEKFYKLEDDINDLEEQIEKKKSYKKDEMQFAGSVLRIDNEGKPVFHEGLIRPADVKRLEKHRNPNAETKSDEKTSGNSELLERPKHSHALATDLALYRKSIAKLAIAKASDLGSDIMLFDVCYRLIGDKYHQHPLSSRFDNTATYSNRKDIFESKAHLELDEVLSSLNRSWIKENKLESFKAFRKLKSAVKSQLVAYCSAYSFETTGIDKDELAFTDYLISESSIDKSDYFTPTKENYFKRIPQPHFSIVASEIMGEQWMADNKAKMKSYVCDRLEQQVQDERKDWVPEGV